MKNLLSLCLPLLLLLFNSYDKEEPVVVGGNLNIAEIPSATISPIETSVTIDGTLIETRTATIS